MKNKYRLLYLFKVLEKYTDFEHPLSTNELIFKLKDEYDIEVTRDTIRTDIQALIQCGFPVEIIKSTQNQFYYDGQILYGPELKILLDAISSSKFITEKKSVELIEKLSSLSNATEAEQLKSRVIVSGRAKSDNEKGYYIVDVINEAIEKKKRIIFQYTEYDQNKNKVLCHDGVYYKVSPYALIWDGDFYYLKGFNENKGQMGTFRLDRIYREPMLLNESITDLPEDFDISQYTKAVFRMYDTDQPEYVTLLCKNKLMNAIVDKFGLDVDTTVVDKDSFMARVSVYASPTFYRWVFGWNGGIKILSPESIKQKYQEMLKSALE